MMVMAVTDGEDLTADLESFSRGLGVKPATTLRFFDRQNFYTVFGDDAQFLALDVRKTKEALKTSKSGLTYTSVSKTQFESEVRDILLVRQYRIQMYGKGQSGGWHLQYTASPGNFGPLDDMLYSCRNNLHGRGLIAISHSDRSFGVVHVDTISKTMRLAHFADDVSLCQLECLLVQLAPKEALVPQRCKLMSLITEKLELNRVTITPLPEKDFFVRCHDLKSTMDRLLIRCTNLAQVMGSFDAVPGLERSLVEESLSAAIKYLDLMLESTGLYELSFMQLSQFMKLDATAVSALNLFPAQRDQHIRLTKDRRSVFGLLNQCRTLPGQRLLSQWIRQPLVDILKINERLDLVDHFVDHSDYRHVLNEQRLRGIPDLVRLSAKLHKQTIRLQECYSLYRLIQSAPQLVEDIGGDDNPYVRIAFSDKIEALHSQLTGTDSFSQNLESVLDFGKLKQREFRINPNVTPQLKHASVTVQDLENEVQQMHSSTARDLGLAEKHLKLNSDDEKGYYFSITNANEKSIRNNRSYRTLPSNKKDGIRFTCDELDQFNVKYVHEKGILLQIESQIMRQFREVVADSAHLIRQLSEVLTFLDAIVALAVAALSSHTPYVRPEMYKAGNGILSITKLRHPCVESVTESFVANDVNLSESDQKFKLVTGPNMGGKSTYIRSAAIAILMAQMGSFVPAESAKISVMDAIFTRVGASDKQLQGNSTFMNEMVETAAILRSATGNSFIAIDELGRGTSTFDGYGIAYAVCKHIARQLKSFCLFATHFHELTELESEEKGIGNLHVAVHPVASGGKGLLLLYQVQRGVSTQSYGIHTAKAAAFPPDMIRLAEAKLHQLEYQMAGVDTDSVVRSIATADLDSDDDIRRLMSHITKVSV